ncbi:uncharacterized protein LOC124925837 [Impatiens glandulifera]|uniref:uncharacterized protein LOC124925837 n=1 Tax=Impatiens glandulifera TaxID=253017 RepID=UPI001FB18FA5|nr:uncharacterized protein LOC124925837 [Impatiens glandulifera]
MQPGNRNRPEAERLLGFAEKLLHGKDFNNSRNYAILAQENDPLLEGSDQILAIADVLMAAEKRISNHFDWYAILQVDRRSDDLELIKRQFRRLAFLLHPDKNKLPFADAAFRIIADAWQVLSDPSKKSLYDNELGFFSRVDLVPQKINRDQNQPDLQENKVLERKSGGRGSGKRGRPPGRGGGRSGGRSGQQQQPATARVKTFWTICPYCYNLYEYPSIYKDCCMQCQKCERSFHGAPIKSMPPIVPGKDAYYCCWGFFPMGFSVGDPEMLKKKFSNPEPPLTGETPLDTSVSGVARRGRPPGRGRGRGRGPIRIPIPISNDQSTAGSSDPAKKKRGRPRKYLQT